MTIVAIFLVSAGSFFLAISAFGLVRFPDFYTRAHVVAKSESLGVAMVILGVIAYYRGGDGTLKLLLLVTFALVANPTAIHALSRAHRLQRMPVEPDGEIAVEVAEGWVETIAPDDEREPTDPAVLATLDEEDIEEIAELVEADEADEEDGSR
jgi:multicomponent Na+:H+ antiporter subunit G